MELVELAPSIIYGAILLFLLGAVAALWSRMGNVQGELGELRGEIGGLKSEVAGLRTSVHERVDRLEASIIGQQAATDRKIDSLQAATDRKIDALQAATDRKIDALQAATDHKFDGLQAATDRRIDGLQAATDGKFDQLQASVDALVKTQHEMQLQAQRNHHQMMAAILAHSHRADSGVHFDLPPDFEPTRAGDD